MKALELTVYPPIPRPRFTYGGDPYGDQWKRERKIIESKRLTDTELAAEYWSEYSGYVREASNILHCQERYIEAAGASFQEASRKAATLHRFATLPHHDEDQP